jgi:hypothetical protein
MVKKTVKKAAKAVETKVEQIVEDVKETANEDVATFTVDKWHVLLAAIVGTVIGLVVLFL